MTESGRPAPIRRSLSRVLYDIAHILESADASDDRLRRVLELLRCAVPFDQCALLETQPAGQSRILVEPEAAPEAQAELAATLDGLVAGLVATRSASERGLRGHTRAPPGARSRCRSSDTAT
jgi:GAF domain-containing protein